MICTAQKIWHYSAFQIKHDVLDEACVTCWVQDKRMQGYDGGNLKKWANYGALDVYGRVILKWNLTFRIEVFGLIYRAQDREKLRAFVNKVMNILAMNCREYFYLFQIRICSMEVAS
jgi:hypothetical protein